MARRPALPPSSDGTPVPSQNLSASASGPADTGLHSGLSRAKDHFGTDGSDHVDAAHPTLAGARTDVHHVIGLLTRRVLPALDEGDARRARDMADVARALLELTLDRCDAVLAHSERVAQPYPHPSPGLTYGPPEVA